MRLTAVKCEYRSERMASIKLGRHRVQFTVSVLLLRCSTQCVSASRAAARAVASGFAYSVRCAATVGNKCWSRQPAAAAESARAPRLPTSGGYSRPLQPRLRATGLATPPRSQRIASAVPRKCCLTPRSSGAPTAGRQRPVGGTRYIFTGRALASCRRRPLNSNVRRRLGCGCGY